MYKSKIIQIDRWHNDEKNKDVGLVWVTCENGLPIKVWLKSSDVFSFKEGEEVNVYICPGKDVFASVYIKKL